MTTGASPSPSIRQRGGTFLGLILGVLLGLAGALAVAVYVTKVPVPFVDRVISRPSNDNAAEAERNKNWNPNAILGGQPAKSPEGAAAQSSAPAASDAPAAAAPASPEPLVPRAEPKPAEAKAAAAKPAKEAAVDAEGKVYTSDPLADLAASKAKGKVVSTTPRADEPAASSTPAEPFTFFVQVGAFRTSEDAQAQRAKLMLMGLDAKISEREQNGRTVYRVRLGPYDRLTDAEKMKDDLAPSGLETALVRVQR